MSDTPRTDEAEDYHDDGYLDYGFYVESEFARQLERELRDMHSTALDYARSSDEFSAVLRTLLHAQYENNSTAKEQFGDFEKFYDFTLERHLAVVRKG